MSEVLRDWKAQLFECFSEPLLSFLYALDILQILPGISIFTSCYISYQQFTILRLQEHDPVFRTFAAAFFCCFGYAYNRSIIREHYQIQGNYLTDCCCHCWCHCCATIQELREIKIQKGLYPNLQQSQQAPIIVQGQVIQMVDQLYPSQPPSDIYYPGLYPQMNQPNQQNYIPQQQQPQYQVLPNTQQQVIQAGSSINM